MVFLQAVIVIVRCVMRMLLNFFVGYTCHCTLRHEDVIGIGIN